MGERVNEGARNPTGDARSRGTRGVAGDIEGTHLPHRSSAGSTRYSLPTEVCPLATPPRRVKWPRRKWVPSFLLKISLGEHASIWIGFPFGLILGGARNEVSSFTRSTQRTAGIQTRSCVRKIFEGTVPQRAKEASEDGGDSRTSVSKRG